MRTKRLRRAALLLATASLALPALPAMAHPDPDAGVTDGPEEAHGDGLDLHASGDLGASLLNLDSSSSDLISSGPSAKVTKNVAVAGRGERLAPNSTTDVWAHDGYAYLGTFQSPCGTGAGYVEGGAVSLNDDVDGPGVPIFDVSNKNEPSYIGSIPSVAGSRINDVKVMEMNQGDILVHSNESCAGGPGGFEIYNVDDPTNPIHLAHVQTDDVNDLTREGFGFVDHGVHNNYLFTRDGRDFNAVQVEGLIGDFQVIDITDPTTPTVASYYTAADVAFPGIDWVTAPLGPVLDANDYLNTGYGNSQNRFLHDHYVTPDGTQAYLANWDAGLILVDLGDLDGSMAELVSVAIDTTSEDGEVNSHSVWPTADGSIVVEGEEDFAPFSAIFEITTGSNTGEYPSAEGAITTPIASLPGGEMTGNTAYVGLGCEGQAVPDQTPMPTASDTGATIALVQRGQCTFTSKVDNAEAAGYSGVVVFNDAARGDALVSMGGDPTDLPGVFVGHSTGLTLMNVTSAGDLILGASGESVRAATVPDGWSGLRVWDYSDPANPILASTFNTPCSANPLDASCQDGGTYSSHNVVVDGTKAYVSWYSEGLLVVDVADPYNPVEVGRYAERGADFEARNGGIQDIWGVYKEQGKPWIYASDRNGGLYILKEYGSGSGKKGKA